MISLLRRTASARKPLQRRRERTDFKPSLERLEGREVPATDLVAQNLAWTPGFGAVDLFYTVAGDPPAAPTTAALYWSADGAFDPSDTLAFQTALDPTAGDHVVRVARSDFASDPPAGTRQLLLVTDPTNAVAETNKANNTVAKVLPDVIVAQLLTFDSRSVTVVYGVANASIGPVSIQIYRSADATIDAGDTVVPLSVPVPIPGAMGVHAVRLMLASPLAIDTAHPYVLARADWANTVPEPNETNNDGGFRTRVLGVVTHGYEAFGFIPGTFPSWVSTMANRLSSDLHYDSTIAFNWAAISSRFRSGMAELAGSQMAAAIAARVTSMKAMWPNDVIDVHVIGHSRGGAVISQAMLGLRTNPIVFQGTAQMTLLDPHPARNDPAFTYYSVNPNSLGGRIAAAVVRNVQGIMNDPRIVIPGVVDIAEDFFQRDPATSVPSGGEHLFNIWGEGPFVGAFNFQVTEPGISHSGMIDWYMRRLFGPVVV